MPIAAKFKSKHRTTPLWAGPQDDSKDGGVTQSMLSRYVCCPERFRLRVVEGLAPIDQFNKSLEFGQMWHTCEEAFASAGPDFCANGNPMSFKAASALKSYCQELCAKYRESQDQIEKWYNVVKVQFPLYIQWWAQHPDVKERMPIMQEQVFKVPYMLPSGRIVYLRGKFDSVDHIGQANGGVYLQENKTTGDIDTAKVEQRLRFDIQTMLYFIALQNTIVNPVAGVRYNVIRRPLSGGKGSIVQKKGSKNVPPETAEEYYARLGGIIEESHGPAADLPEGQHYFFMRWKCEIGTQDVDRFKTQFLHPVLENLCDDYQWWEWALKTGKDAFNCEVRKDMFIHRARTWRLPYGVYNVIAEGGSTDLDEFLDNGNEVGLTRDSKLFTELQ